MNFRRSHGFMALSLGPLGATGPEPSGQSPPRCRLSRSSVPALPLPGSVLGWARLGFSPSRLLVGFWLGFGFYLALASAGFGLAWALAGFGLSSLGFGFGFGFDFDFDLILI